MRVLVTGGAGYIGSHAALRLLDEGHEVTVVDNLSRGNAGAVEVLARAGDFQFVEASLADREVVEEALRRRRIELVLHFAAFAYVSESVERPDMYYRNNVDGSLSLFEAMGGAGVDRIIFSSSCATYGVPPPELVPIAESCPQQPINPYGRSKRIVEQRLAELAESRRSEGRSFAYASLRYFNVAGADLEGRIGEDHRPETHLVPICLEVALGQRPSVEIYGRDYDTADGTCVRDFVHVGDLVDAHLAVMERVEELSGEAFNVGVGEGRSVLEVIETCRRVTGREIEAVDGPRRPGDPPELYADPSKLERIVGWRAQHRSLEETIASAWVWHRQHPDGFG